MTRDPYDEMFDTAPRSRGGPKVSDGPRKPVAPADAEWHGTLSGYTNHHCGCEPCTSAVAAYMADYRTKSADRVAPPGVSDLSRYQYYGHRDDAARAANNERRARQRKKAKSV